MLECIMLQLRLADGISLSEFAAVFGAVNARKLVKGLTPHLACGQALLQHPGGECLSREEAANLVAEGTVGFDLAVRLHDPSGFIVSNGIISDVFVTMDESL